MHERRIKHLVAEQDPNVGLLERGNLCAQVANNFVAAGALHIASAGRLDKAPLSVITNKKLGYFNINGGVTQATVDGKIIHLENILLKKYVGREVGVVLSGELAGLFVMPVSSNKNLLVSRMFWNSNQRLVNKAGTPDIYQEPQLPGKVSQITDTLLTDFEQVYNNIANTYPNAQQAFTYILKEIGVNYGDEFS